MMYSAYKLNKQDDNTQPWRTAFPIWNQSVVPCPVITVASWPAYRFLKRQVRWTDIPISWRIFQFVVIYPIKCFGVVSKAEIVVFLEVCCFFNSPTDADNLISGSSAFSKTSLNIWNFTVHVLLNSGLENFEHYFISMWDECNCMVVWAFFAIAFLFLFFLINRSKPLTLVSLIFALQITTFFWGWGSFIFHKDIVPSFYFLY